MRAAENQGRFTASTPGTVANSSASRVTGPVATNKISRNGDVNGLSGFARKSRLLPTTRSTRMPALNSRATSR